MSAEPAGTTSPFGVLLRRWRRHLGLSQLALAAAVGSTSRHLSFLETGRSRPGRQMVLRLGQAMDIPLREQNRLLAAAGLAAAHPQVALEDAELAPFRAAIHRLLSARLPYPAIVVDEHWTVLMANLACGAVWRGVGWQQPRPPLLRRPGRRRGAGQLAAGRLGWP